MRLTIGLLTAAAAAALAATPAAASAAPLPHAPFAWENVPAGPGLGLPTGRPSELVLDADGDGRPDRVVADYRAGVVTFLATGATTTAWAPYAWTLATGDLNGDGHPDVVAGTAETTSESGEIDLARTLLGDGKGGFTQGPTLPARSGIAAVAIGDFDGDGHQDVALASSRGTVATYLGDGAGGLAPSPYPLGATLQNAERITARDYDGDGRVDLGVTAGDGGPGQVLLNRARPGYRLPSATGPARCFRSGRAHIVVRGSDVTQVGFQLDGTGPMWDRFGPNTPGGGFLLSLGTKGLKRGTHRVTASVTYGNGQFATLKVTLRRC
jgi:hypothetical protein